MRRLPDPELIALARQGTAEAAEALFDRYWVHAWRAAYAVTADRELANDAAQEAIERAFAALDRFDETRPFSRSTVRSTKFEVAVAAGIRQNRRLKWLAQATFTTFDPTHIGGEGYLNIGGLTAGWPPPPNVRSGLSVSLERRTPSVVRPELTTRGDAFEDKYECFPPKTILFRIRAVFRKPTSLRVDRRGERSLLAISRITAGSIVVQTLRGKRIAYTQVFDSGKARLFTAPDCFPDPT